MCFPESDWTCNRTCGVGNRIDTLVKRYVFYSLFIIRTIFLANKYVDRGRAVVVVLISVWCQWETLNADKGAGTSYKTCVREHVQELKLTVAVECDR